MSSLFYNVGWKILSLIVAFSLWFMVMSSNSIEISKEVILDIDVPADLMVANDIPEKVTFRLSGSKFFLRTVVNSLDSIRVDLSKAKAGPAFYRIEREALRLPIGVKVLSISPSSIAPVLEPVLRKEVPVQVFSKNKVPEGYRLLKLQAKPETVRIKGPRSEVEKISAIKAPAVDLLDIPSSLKWEVSLNAPSTRIRFDEEHEPKIFVEVEPTGSNFRVAGVPVKVESDRKTTLNFDKVALYVSCAPKLIQTITPEKVHAFVTVKETKSGTYEKTVNVNLPQGVKLVKVVPSKVQVHVE